MSSKKWVLVFLATVLVLAALLAALVLLAIAAAAQIASFEVSVRFYEMKRK